MSEPKHKLAVFIGRFQPFHIGHLNVVKAVADQADSMLILVGSAYRPRSWKNPFTYNERKDFIAASVEGLSLQVDTLPLVDTLYNDRAWATNVRTAVRLHLRSRGLDPEHTTIALTGFEKDKSSQYLRWFPEWEMIPAAPTRHDGRIVNATDLREALFFPGTDPADEHFGPSQVATVRAWMAENEGAVKQVQAEALFVKEYRQRVAAAEKIYGYPFPVNTADAVVIQSGHILMIKRQKEPGRGLWALPGGHIDSGETALEAVVRELYEEAGLDMPKGAMRSRLRHRQVFDHPERSERGWVRTEAFVFELQDREQMERVKSGSDAIDAKWVSITEITPDTIFEDHFDIIQALVPDVPFAYSSILMAHAT
ncbi:MAG: NUDIX domain-containing protein [Pseudomonadota bacterium]